MTRFIPVYSTRTGKKLDPVPEHYLDHPVLGQAYRRTPRSAANQKKSTTPDPPASGDDKKE